MSFRLINFIKINLIKYKIYKYKYIARSLVVLLQGFGDVLELLEKDIQATRNLYKIKKLTWSILFYLTQTIYLVI